jgi:hypothetical protein
VADFDGDGWDDIATAEDGGSASRVIVFWNRAQSFEADVINRGTPLHTLLSADLNGDGRIDLVGVGAQSLVWWENRIQRRK